MLLGLSVDAVVGGYVQDRCISLTSTGNHVLDEVTVTRCVDDGKVVVRSVELLVCDIDGDSTLSLLLQTIHNVGKTESGLSTL